MSQSSIADLPEEMMVLIFSLLSTEDMKSVMLVCKGWSEIGEDPTLWASAVLIVNSREDFYKLNNRRFEMVQEVNVGEDCSPWIGPGGCRWSDQDWSDLFEELAKIHTLVRLNIRCFTCCNSNLSCVEPGKVLTVFKRLEELRMEKQLNNFSSEMSEQVYSGIAANEFHVKVLQVMNNSTTTISPGLFASAVCNVEEVVLCSWDIKRKQIKALFQALTREGRRPLKRLTLISGNTHYIEPALMGAAVNRLEEFEVANTTVTSDQIIAILTKIEEDGSCLKKLMLGDLTYLYFMDVDPALVRRIRGKFGKFYYFDEDYIRDDEGYDPYGKEEESDDVWNSVEDSEYAKEVKRIMGINIVD